MKLTLQLKQISISDIKFHYFKWLYKYNKIISSLEFLIFVEDIPLCLEYNIIIKFLLWQNFLFILLFQSLATSFGLIRQSSDYYLQKNLKILVYISYIYYNSSI
jgi:hypothetical protein